MTRVVALDFVTRQAGLRVERWRHGLFAHGRLGWGLWHCLKADARFRRYLGGDDSVCLPRGADGAIPEDDRLAVGANGEIFGSAGAGGDFDRDKTGCADFSNVPGGCGVVFALKP